jgi:hypothetical protein
MNNYYTLDQSPIHQQPSKIIIDSGITSNWKYRQYMQKNSNQIMKYNAMDSINASGNNPYTLLNATPVGNTPFLYNSLHETNGPTYGHGYSDLKSDYLTKERMKSRMVSPSIPTNF